MTAPLVTVGIPFFDERRYLAAAIRSILAQSWTRLEILLVNDGSTDGSVEIARSFADPRVRVLDDGERRFLPARLNEIVRDARGELVARMDADDVVHPERLRRQIEALEQAGSACVGTGTWAALVDGRDEPMAIVESRIDPQPSTRAAVALERGLMTHASLVARRDWLVAHPYDETLTRAEDRDLWCRAAGSVFTVVPEPLYVVRTTPRDPSFLEEYVESQRQNRILYRRYGARSIGALRTSRRYAESFAKEWLMRGAVRAGLADRLVRRRGRMPTALERALVTEALASSRQRP